MKTLACLTLLLVALGVPAQDFSENEPVDDSISPVTYQVPVIYEAPVIYQAAVVYYAPVYFYEPPVMVQPERPCSAPSTVTYIGGGGGARIQSNCGNHGSTVVYFGGQQARAQGYAFSRPR